MSAKVTIEIDAYCGLEPEGIYSSVYFGDESQDPIELRMTWDEIIADEIEMHCIPNGPFTVGNGYDSVADMMHLVSQLRAAAKKLEESINERGILLRDWMIEEADKKGISHMDADRSIYTVDYAEYLNYMMEKR
jgi:hypothetical protein